MLAPIPRWALLCSSKQGRPKKPRTSAGTPTAEHSPTHSQVHCKKQPLPPGMASLWPLREETAMPITLAGFYSLPQRHLLRPSPRVQSRPLLALQCEVTAKQKDRQGAQSS